MEKPDPLPRLLGCLPPDPPPCADGEENLRRARAYLKSQPRLLPCRIAPTAPASRLLSGRDAGELAQLNRQLVEDARSGGGGTSGRFILAALSCAGKLLDPFEERDFLALCGASAEQAAWLREAGADALLCPALPGLAPARAVVLGVRSSGLPLIPFLLLGENGRAPCGSDPLAALCTLQELGIAAFGLRGPASALLDSLAQLRPYASVPLAAALPPPKGLSPDGYEALAGEVLGAGAQLLAIAGGADPAALDAVRRALARHPAGKGAVANHQAILCRSYRRVANCEAFCNPLFTAAGESGSFLLGEDLGFSPPLTCADDMAGALLEREHDSCDALLVRIDSPLDARLFAANAHLARLPVAFLSDEEACLELALCYYSGRAIVSSMCDLPRPVLERLARDYGAAVL